MLPSLIRSSPFRPALLPSLLLAGLPRWRLALTAGVEWKLSPDAQVYAKDTHAFKPGGYSAYADDERLLAFDPEKCWNTEAGLRTQWLDGDLMVNVAPLAS